MILLINTADDTFIFIGLVKGERIIAKRKFKAPHQQAEKILSAIDRLLKAKSPDVKSGSRLRLWQTSGLKAIKGIIIATGPGAFTALRIGVTTANTLGWALGIPVVGVPGRDFTASMQLAKKAHKLISRASSNNLVVPRYGKAPRVTIK